MRAIRSDVLKESVFYTALGSGLTLFVMPRSRFQKQHAALSCEYGSIDTCFIHPVTGEKVSQPAGIAHFLEHKLFERESGSVFDDFSRLGVSANAYTTRTSTTYLFTATQHFEEALSLLLSFVREPYFTDETVEKERGIIRQEIEMYSDMPQVRLQTNLLGAMYHRHPVRVDIGGTRDSIREITPEMLYICHETFYHPTNMVLFVSGDLEPEQVVEMAERIDAPYTKPERPPVKRAYPDEPEQVAESEVVESMAVSLPLVLVGYKFPGTLIDPKSMMRRQAAADVMLGALFGRSSSLFEEVYERRLLSNSFSASFEAAKGFAHALIGGESGDPTRLSHKICEGVEEARRTGVPFEDICRMKRKMIGEFVALFNSPEKVGRLFVSTYFKGASVFDYYDALMQVSEEDIRGLLDEGFSESNLCESIVKPDEKSRRCTPEQ